MKDVWDVNFQELLVIGHGHETQTFKASCEIKKPSVDERIGDTSKYDIK